MTDVQTRANRVYRAPAADYQTRSMRFEFKVDITVTVKDWDFAPIRPVAVLAIGTTERAGYDEMKINTPMH